MPPHTRLPVNRQNSYNSKQWLKNVCLLSLEQCESIKQLLGWHSSTKVHNWAAHWNKAFQLHNKEKAATFPKKISWFAPFTISPESLHHHPQFFIDIFNNSEAKRQRPHGGHPESRVIKANCDNHSFHMAEREEADPLRWFPPKVMHEQNTASRRKFFGCAIPQPVQHLTF